MNAKRNGWRWNKTTSLLSLVLGCMLMPTIALGQPKTTTIIRENPWPNIETRVEKLYNDGIDAADKKQWEKARKLFAEAFELDRRPQIAANLANAELASGKARDAAEHFDYFLREDKEADAEARAEVKALFDSAALRIVIVKVTVDLVGADVFVNREFVGKSPLSRRIFLEPGDYSFEATMAGVKPGSQSLELSRGASVGVKLVMGEATNATVLADGTVQAKQKERDWRNPLKYASFGVGAVGLGMSIGFTTAFMTKNRDLAAQRNALLEAQETGLQDSTSGNKMLCPEGVTKDSHCKELNDTLTTRNAYTKRAFVGYGLTAIGAAGTLFWALTRPKVKERKAQKPLNVGIIGTPSQIIVFGAF